MKRLLYFWILLFHAVVWCDKKHEFTREEIERENGQKITICDYYRIDDNDTEFNITAVFYSEKYDTVEIPRCDFMYSCTRHDQPEPISSSSQPQARYEQPEPQQHSPANRNDPWGNWDDHRKDQRLDDAFLEQQRDRNQAYYDQPKSYPAQKHSHLYLCCQEKKEYYVGPSQETIKQRKAAFLQQEKERKNAAPQVSDILPEVRDISELEQAYMQHQENFYPQATQEFIEFMHKRDAPFEQSLVQKNLVEKKFRISPQVTGLLQAHKYDTTPLQNLTGLAIQYHLTSELLAVLESFAARYPQTIQDVTESKIICYGINLVVQTQQTNMEGALLATIDGVNCSKGIERYITGLQEKNSSYLQTAVHFFNAAWNSSFGIFIKNGLQGVGIAVTLEKLVTYGITAAPTVTVACTTCLVAVASVGIAAFCLQSLTELTTAGKHCMQGNWDGLRTQLNQVTSFLQSDQAIALFGNLVGAMGAPTPNTSMLFNQIQSLRPVVTTMKENGQKAVHNFCLATKKAIENQYNQTVNLLKTPEFMHYNLSYKQRFGTHFFTVAENAIDHCTKIVPSKVLRTIPYFTEKSTIIPDFLQTAVGIAIAENITQAYESIVLQNLAKEYARLVASNAPAITLNSFCRCCQISLVPKAYKNIFEIIHEKIKNIYPGLPEYSEKYPFLTVQIRHILYPNISQKYNDNYTKIEKFILDGFHHDQYQELEKSGLFTYKNKIYGKAQYGAQECYQATTNWGNGIICNDIKSFFPTSWSSEKVIQTICEAAQNRVKDLSDPLSKTRKKYSCRTKDGLLIDIVFNNKNTIISAYPSADNFI